jgi:hypothetical protein
MDWGRLIFGMPTTLPEPMAMVKRKFDCCGNIFHNVAMTNTPWHIAAQDGIMIQHGYFKDNGEVELERGVNYFVLALKAIGVEGTFASCEGHPTGFYIGFIASYEVAKKVHAMPGCSRLGQFRVELCDPDRWAMRLDLTGECTQENKEAALAELSVRWQKELGVPMAQRKF